MWKYDEKIEVIDNFNVEPYTCFTNFSPHPVVMPMPLFEGNQVTFKTAEHAFQTFKCTNIKDATYVMSANTPGEAKKRGRSIVKHDGWDTMSTNVMRDIVSIKVLMYFDVRRVLINTSNAIIIEGNTWGDKLWGMVKNSNGEWEGENRLGQILMELRWKIAWGEYTKKISYLRR